MGKFIWGCRVISRSFWFRISRSGLGRWCRMRARGSVLLQGEKVRARRGGGWSLYYWEYKEQQQQQLLRSEWWKKNGRLVSVDFTTPLPLAILTDIHHPLLRLLHSAQFFTTYYRSAADDLSDSRPIRSFFCHLALTTPFPLFFRRRLLACELHPWDDSPRTRTALPGSFNARCTSSPLKPGGISAFFVRLGRL